MRHGMRSRRRRRRREVREALDNLQNRAERGPAGPQRLVSGHADAGGAWAGPSRTARPRVATVARAPTKKVRPIRNSSRAGSDGEVCNTSGAAMVHKTQQSWVPEAGALSAGPPWAAGTPWQITPVSTAASE